MLEEDYSNDQIKGLILKLVLQLDPNENEIIDDRKHLLNVESSDGTKVSVSIPSDAAEVK